MASLTGTKIKDTYDALLKVSDNGALDGTLQTITVDWVITQVSVYLLLEQVLLVL